MLIIAIDGSDDTEAYGNPPQRSRVSGHLRSLEEILVWVGPTRDLEARLL